MDSTHVMSASEHLEVNAKGYNNSFDSKVWFNTPSNLRFALAPAQTTQRLQKFGIKPKNPLAGSRGRV
jgi:hypothetical protein